jgi:hypothetical protein
VVISSLSSPHTQQSNQFKKQILLKKHQYIANKNYFLRQHYIIIDKNSVAALFPLFMALNEKSIQDLKDQLIPSFPAQYF